MSGSRPPLRASLNKLFCPPSRERNTATAHFRSVLAAFVGLGFHVGVWAVLLADLAGFLALSPGSLGVALSVMTASGIAALLAGGRLADRFGRRPFLLLGAGGTGVLFLLLVPASGFGGYAALLAVLVLGGVCASSWDLAVNALGGDHERQHGGRIMTPLHAGFSGGAATGALLSGAALWTGVGFGAVYTSVGVSLLLLAAILGFVPLPRHELEATDGTELADDEARGSSVLLVPAVAACALIVFVSFSTDAALEGFLSLYLRNALSSGALLGGAGIAAFHLAATVGRLGGGAVLGRLGERATLTACGLASALGMACVALASSPGLAAAALLLVGVAAALVAPVVFSLTARAAPGQSGRAISLVTVSGYVAFTVGPLLVGTVANLSSLRTSLLLPVAFGVCVAGVARFLPSSAGRGTEGRLSQ